MDNMLYQDLANHADPVAFIAPDLAQAEALRDRVGDLLGVALAADVSGASSLIARWQVATVVLLCEGEVLGILGMIQTIRTAANGRDDPLSSGFQVIGLIPDALKGDHRFYVEAVIDHALPATASGEEIQSAITEMALLAPAEDASGHVSGTGWAWNPEQPAGH